MERKQTPERNTHGTKAANQQASVFSSHVLRAAPHPHAGEGLTPSSCTKLTMEHVSAKPKTAQPRGSSMGEAAEEPVHLGRAESSQHQKHKKTKTETGLHQIEDQQDKGQPNDWTWKSS